MSDEICYCNVCGRPSETCECSFDFWNIIDDCYDDMWEEPLPTIAKNITFESSTIVVDPEFETVLLQFCDDCGRSVELCDCPK
jgi:hypothetical protein